MTIKEFVNWLFLGTKKGSTKGSNTRRRMSRLSIYISIFCLLNLMFFGALEKNAISYVGSIILIIWAIAFFIFVIAVIPFLTSNNFVPNAVRLFLDGIVSIFQMIVVFATFYSLHGICPPDWSPLVEATDYLYFSAVTFSTLGFGDFTPSAASRLAAGLQALIGNLHLGIVVAAIFFAAVEQQLKSGKD